MSSNGKPKTWNGMIGQWKDADDASTCSTARTKQICRTKHSSPPVVVDSVETNHKSNEKLFLKFDLCDAREYVCYKQSMVCTWFVILQEA
jgi:hypothetical protein